MRMLQQLVLASALTTMLPCPSLAQGTSDSPAVRARDVEIGAHCNRGNIEKTVEIGLGVIKACYEEALDRKPGLAGRVRVQWGVDSRGRPKAVQMLLNTTEDEQVGGCIEEVVGGITYEPPPGRMCVVRWEFVLGNAQDGANTSAKPSPTKPLQDETIDKRRRKAVDDFNRLTGTEHSYEEMATFTTEGLEQHNKALASWQKRTSRFDNPPKRCSQLIAWVCESQTLLATLNGTPSPAKCREKTKKLVQPFRNQLKDSHCQRVFELAKKADANAGGGKHKLGLAFAALLVDFFEKLVEAARAEEEAARAEATREGGANFDAAAEDDCVLLSKMCDGYSQRFSELQRRIARVGLTNVSESDRLEMGQLAMTVELCRMLVGTVNSISYYAGRTSSDCIVACRDGLRTLKDAEGAIYGGGAPEASTSTRDSRVTGAGTDLAKSVQPAPDPSPPAKRRDPRARPGLRSQSRHRIDRDATFKRNVAVVYPEEAKAMEIQGRVYLTVSVDPEGKVADVELKKGLHPVLDAAAIEAAWQMEFEPALREGTPVSTKLTVPFLFSLE